MKLEFKDNSKFFSEAMQEAAIRALEKCGQAAEGYAKRLADGFKNPTGNLKNSITHRVDESELAAYIGTDVEYAGYVELGTGHYSTIGGGTPKQRWAYLGDDGEWHMGYPQAAQPFLKPAVADHVEQYLKTIKDEMENA